MPDNAVTGVVTAIDRANSQVHAILTTGAAIVAAYLPRRMPWPLCTGAFIEQDGAWTCWGPVGDRRVIVHDDFTRVPTLAAEGPALCDTPWRLHSPFTPTTQPSLAPSSVADAQGCARPMCGVFSGGGGLSNAAVDLLKDDLALTVPAAPGALWLSARLECPVVAGCDILELGFATAIDDVPTDPMAIILAIGNFYITGRGHSTQTIPTSPFVKGQFNIYDLVMSENLMAAWIDGDGPYWLSDTAIVAGLGTSVWFGGESDTLADGFDIDWAHVEQLGNITHPSAVGIAGL